MEPNDLIQKKYDRLFDLVRRMRGHQIEFFKYRASADLKIARDFERKVDKLIRSELEERKTKQRQLF